jgi:hypothetical protein
VLPVAGLAVLAVAIGLWTSRSTSHAGPPVCSTTASATETSAIAYTLTPAQAANAATIAGVARRDGLPDHAVTIALATALQESKLENLSGGDRDSVGLFQQRPSQGWGTPAQLRDPIYAAQAFYHRLTSVTGWRTAAVTTAAQAVQRSAAPYAYADWEPEARALARAFTGQAVAGLTCLSLPRGPAGSSVAALARTELGRSITARPATVAQGWGDASWLVAHAQQLGLAQVGYRGEQWTRARGTWAGAAGAGSLLSFRTG